MRSGLAVALVAAALAGCMEVEQVSTPGTKQPGQTVKRDTVPWANAPTEHERLKWTKGDRTSWETQIKDRQLAQHEHRRIYQ